VHPFFVAIFAIVLKFEWFMAAILSILHYTYALIIIILHAVCHETIFAYKCDLASNKTFNCGPNEMAAMQP